MKVEFTLYVSEQISMLLYVMMMYDDKSTLTSDECDFYLK